MKHGTWQDRKIERQQSEIQKGRTDCDGGNLYLKTEINSGGHVSRLGFSVTSFRAARCVTWGWVH